METWYMAGALVIVLVAILVWVKTARDAKRMEEKLMKKAASRAKRAKAAAARKVDLPMTEEQMARAQNMGPSGDNRLGVQNTAGNGLYGRSEL